MTSYSGEGGLRADRPTISDVARRAGVSAATVSNALSGRRYVEERTRERVLSIAAELGYSPNLRARRLRTGRADTIAIFSSMPFAIAGGRARMGFLMEIAAAAAAESLQNGMALILVPPLEKSRPPLAELPIDGALVVEPLADDPEIEQLRSRGIPVVAIGREPGSPIPSVDLQSATCVRMLLDHLHDAGSRRIALITGAQPRNAHLEAVEASRVFGIERHLDIDVLRIDEFGGEAAAREATRSLLTAHPEIDALCVTIDTFASGAAAAAHDLDRRVPDDLRIVTRYDGVRSRECRPPLTALDLRLDEVANLAVGLLLDHIRGDESRKLIVAPMPRLVTRASSV